MSYQDLLMEKIEREHQNKTTELQRQLEEAVSLNFNRAIGKISKLAPVRITYPGQLMSLEDIKKNILMLLEPTLLTLCQGNIINFDLSDDIKSEYYDTLITPQIPNITYALLCVTSDYILGMLLYYVQKEFVFNFILNDVVKTNIGTAINNVRNIINKKDIMDTEIKKSEDFSNLLQDLIESFMIELNVDKIQEKILAVINFDIKDKNYLISQTFDESKYFIPDVLYSIVLNGSANDTDVERATRFVDRYIVTHSDGAVAELFKHYSKGSDINPEKVRFTILERNAFNGLNNLQLLDGLNFVENKIANRIITFTSSDADSEFIEKSDVLKNIKAVVDNFHKYNSTIKLSGNDVIITYEDGSVKTCNVRKEGLSKIINDPFNIFERSEYIKHMFFNNKARSAFYQTGITKEEDSDLLMKTHNSRLQEKSPEERVQHRNFQIQKLVSQLSKDKNLMDEYERLTTQKIRDIKYMNPTQSKTYVISDKGRLLLILTETEYLYRQLLNEVAAQATSDNYNIGGK